MFTIRDKTFFSSTLEINECEILEVCVVICFLCNADESW